MPQQMLYRIALLALTLALLSSSASLAQGNAYSFPITVSKSGRYLIDAKAQPFFYLADTGWQIFNKLTKEEALQYLEDRRQKGFTAIQAQIISHFPGDAVSRDAEAAFDNKDLAKPRDPYFDHVEWVLTKAAEKGLLMVLSTAWFGYRRSGWYNYLTTDNADPYARYLAKRFKKFGNISWIHAGDWKPGSKVDAVRVMANILKTEAPHQLQTVHNGFNGSSTDDFGIDNWLAINMTVAVDPVETYSSTLSAYNREHPHPLPVVMGEPPYENERTDAYGLRSRAYWTLLSGGAGFAYGVIPVWNFDKGWQQALQAEGGGQMKHVRSLLTARRWYDLIPDQANEFVVAGRGKYGSTTFATAAHLADGSLLLAYLPEEATLTVNMARMSGSVHSRWYDPTNGTYKLIPGSPFPNQGTRAFSSTGFNAAGRSDWVLVLETVSR